jgi:hypothetical protein
VIAGAPAGLLGTYEAERQPVAARVLGRSTELYAGLDQRRLSSLQRGDEERQIALSYRGGPLAPADDSATATLHAGDRAPDAPSAGPGISRLFDAYRAHFTLLAFGPDAAAAMPAVPWPARGAELHRHAVHTSPGNGHLVDASGLVSSIYGITADTLVLIRPDGYLATSSPATGTPPSPTQPHD